MGRITVKQGDITQEKVDVIVNAANTALVGGGGVDGAIHRASGPSVMEECRKIGGCKTGEAVITGAGKLKAKKIIHTPGPVWRGGSSGEEKLLRNSYRNSFKLAIRNSLETIALPAISTGVYGYPVAEAAKVALEEGMKYVNRFDEIRFICYSASDYHTYREVYKKLAE